MEFETKVYALYSLLLLLWWLLSYTNFKRAYLPLFWALSDSHLMILTFTVSNNNLLILEMSESVLVLKGPQGRINRAVWGPLNKTIISAGEDAVIRIWDAEVR